MDNLVLMGDSIFDNAGYVDPGDAVMDQLTSLLNNKAKATLLAIDGDVTSEVHAQLESLPDDATHIFISCGGNDALRIAHVLNEDVSCVGEAMELFSKIKGGFSERYSTMLLAVREKCKNVTVCTIYDCIPDYDSGPITALSMFNEVILREAFKHGFPVIDLRIVCDKVADYSMVSPIEPSRFGAGKIASRIWNVTTEHNFEDNQSRVYT